MQKYEDAMQVLHKLVLEMTEEEKEILREKIREAEKDGRDKSI